MDKGIAVIAMVIPIVAIIFAIGSPIVLVAAIVHHRMRKARLMHQTAAKLLEKGRGLPCHSPPPGLPWQKRKGRFSSTK